jgi:DNA-binding transcriptional LysR family regulator
MKAPTNISFEKLRVFFYAAKFCNFSKAAKELFVTEGAVSQQIKDLEWKLGKRLFHRRKTKLELTDEGKVLLGLVDPLVYQFDSIIEDFVDSSNSLQGSLKIAATQSLILNLLPPALQRFEKEHPSIKIIAFNRPPAKIAEMVLSGGAELGVGPLVDIPEELEAKELIKSPWILIAPADHPLSRYKTITPKEIASFPLILSTRDTGHGFAVENFIKTYNLNFKVAMKMGRWEVVKRYVELGLGIAIIPEICLNNSDKGRILTRSLKHLLESLCFGLLTNKRTHLSAAAEGFTKMLSQLCLNQSDP